MPRQGYKFPLPDDEVVFPDKTILDGQIAAIVERGMHKPLRFVPFLRAMYQEVGFRYIFRDWTEILFVSLVCLAFVALGAFGAGTSHEFENGMAYGAIFMGSPLLYLILAVMSFGRKRMQDTYEMEMTCKYNVYQLAGFRMLLFSCISIAVNAVSISVMASVSNSINLVQALMISLTALLLFSGAFLYVLTRVRSEKATYMVSAGWIVLNVILLEWSASFYRQLLLAIPWYGYAAVMLLGAVWYWRGLKNLVVIRNTDGGLAYAHSSKRD